MNRISKTLLLILIALQNSITTNYMEPLVCFFVFCPSASSPRPRIRNSSHQNIIMTLRLVLVNKPSYTSQPKFRQKTFDLIMFGGFRIGWINHILAFRRFISLLNIYHVRERRIEADFLVAVYRRTLRFHLRIKNKIAQSVTNDEG